jgi:hypothetical protein
MRGLLFIVAAIFLLALVGWISFSNTPGRSSINLETGEIKQDTQKMMDSGEQLIHRAQEPDRAAPLPQSEAPQGT